ncbi:ComF family protein [Streptomyces phaeoluteigriseus]|uniref:ComF family protein n=1 Tax=Streptomyces phaeoluteigriseus TaxID=114686 RepID=A0ABY4ZI93_9ACTN|nr:ComF family protein [Streptomyces phaeoluteigriseus]USQ88660.1 ComF family protein [Streptomyces phaeoluteigriseus]
MESVRRWWHDLSGLVLPAECGGCGTARTVLCPECRTALHGGTPRRVRPDPEPPGLPAVHAAARYADEVRAVLLAHKERGALALTRPLGAALAGAVRVGVGEVGEGEGPPPRVRDLLLVPVPSAPRATRSRGHDPARRIALAAAAELRGVGVPARVAAVLRQRRVVADQAGLNSRQRLDNLVGALAVVAGGGRLLGGAGAVVLVDDVVTTGASLAEAARAVRAAVQTEEAAGAFGWAREEEGAAPVYGGAAREGRGVRPSGVRKGGTGPVPVRQMGAGRAGDLLCAAVVAAPPDAFEINRN